MRVNLNKKEDERAESGLIGLVVLKSLAFFACTLMSVFGLSSCGGEDTPSPALSLGGSSRVWMRDDLLLEEGERKKEEGLKEDKESPLMKEKRALYEEAKEEPFFFQKAEEGRPLLRGEVLLKLWDEERAKLSLGLSYSFPKGRTEVRWKLGEADFVLKGLRVNGRDVSLAPKGGYLALRLDGSDRDEGPFQVDLDYELEVKSPKTAKRQDKNPLEALMSMGRPSSQFEGDGEILPLAKAMPKLMDEELGAMDLLLRARPAEVMPLSLEGGRVFGEEKDLVFLKGFQAFELPVGQGSVRVFLPMDLSEAQPRLSRWLKDYQDALERLQEHYGRHSRKLLWVLPEKRSGRRPYFGKGHAYLPLSYEEKEAPKAREMGELGARFLEALLEESPFQEAFDGSMTAGFLGLSFFQSWDEGQELEALLKALYFFEGARLFSRASDGIRGEERFLILHYRLPFQWGIQKGLKEPLLLDGGASENSPLYALKAGLFAEALKRILGEEPYLLAMKELFALRPKAQPLSPDELEVLFLSHAGNRGRTKALWSQWMRERTLSQSLGPFQGKLLLEFFLLDGLKKEGSEFLLRHADLLLSQKGGKQLLEGLKAGKLPDEKALLAYLGQAFLPSLERAWGEDFGDWFSLGLQLLSDEEREEGLGVMLEKLKAELLPDEGMKTQEEP